LDAVESKDAIESVSSINRALFIAAHTFASAPFFAHRLNLIYTECHFPYFSGNDRHLQPLSQTKCMASGIVLLKILTFPL
jgi:hypothetical protein